MKVQKTRIDIRIDQFKKIKFKLKIDEFKINVTDFFIICINAFLEEDEKFMEFLSDKIKHIKKRARQSKKLKQNLENKSFQIEETFANKPKNEDLSSDDVTILYDLLEKNSKID